MQKVLRHMDGVIEKIIPAEDPTIATHPVISSQRCIARRLVNPSHGWYRPQRNAFGKQIR